MRIVQAFRSVFQRLCGRTQRRLKRPVPEEAGVDPWYGQGRTSKLEQIKIALNSNIRTGYIVRLPTYEVLKKSEKPVNIWGASNILVNL